MKDNGLLGGRSSTLASNPAARGSILGVLIIVLLMLPMALLRTVDRGLKSKSIEPSEDLLVASSFYKKITGYSSQLFFSFPIKMQQTIARISAAT